MNDDLREFCQEWLRKADTYNEDNTRDHFDKFFTLFVAYNALYAETARKMINSGVIKPNQDTDKKSATEHVPAYFGHVDLANEIKRDRITSVAVSEFIEQIENGNFYFHVKKSTDEPDRAEDHKHVNRVKNGNEKEFCESCLIFIYKARCNMFHGSKQFHMRQVNILKPMMVVLSKVITVLMDKLIADQAATA